jgi:hypothetical protein
VKLALCVVVALAFGAAAAEPLQVLSEKRIRLGVAGAPEWQTFANDPPQANRFELRFRAEPNATEATLFIRQDDVKQVWPVELNGKRIGQLFTMEADLVHTLAVPAGALRPGENVLTFVPPLDRDDIILHEITLDRRATESAIGEATLSVKVLDGDGQPLPARITVVGANGALAALVAVKDAPPLAIRPGVAYSGGSEARLGLQAGRYTVFASRGFEYSRATEQIEVAAGNDRAVVLQLVREVATPGLVSCDPHVHTFTCSRHGDATMDERMLTLAGEGIELPIATDHNFYADFAEPAKRLGLSGFFTPVTGNEVTTKTGHFNAFPIAPGSAMIDSQLTDWTQLMSAIRETAKARVIILNHPRSIHSGFRPFDPAHFNAVTGDNLRGGEFTFNGIELLNSGAQQTDYLRVYRDWFALLNRGYRITAAGTSDSHDVSRFIVGQARTYLAAPDEMAGKIDVDRACQSFVEGRALVSMGLLAQMRVEEKFTVGDLATALPENVRVEVQVSGPSWVRAARVELFANGTRIREADIDQKNGTTGGEKARVRWTIPRPAHDVHLVAIATGPAVTAPFWAMTRPYQPTSAEWEGRAIGSTNPIWLDADGDGRFAAARGYAEKLVEQHGGDRTALIKALARFDEATAAQAASVCLAKGIDLQTAALAAALQNAAPQVARGISSYFEAAALSNRARAPKP